MRAHDFPSVPLDLTFMIRRNVEWGVRILGSGVFSLAFHGGGLRKFENTSCCTPRPRTTPFSKEDPILGVGYSYVGLFCALK